MQMTPVSLSVSSTPASTGVAVQLSGMDSELTNSVSFPPVDEVTVSEEARNPDMRRPKSEYDAYTRNRQVTVAGSGSGSEHAEAETEGASRLATDEAEAELVRELKKRDQEVRAHEQAHASIGGVYAGNASFGYETGPDGVRYAVEGEVSVDLSQVANDPQATLDKMEQVRRAALAPAEPSSQDRLVAAQAGQVAASALSDLAAEQSSRRQDQAERLQEERQRVRADLQEAKDRQKEAEAKKEEEGRISAADRFAENNARMQRISEVLLQISIPAPVSAGQLLDDVV